MQASRLKKLQIGYIPETPRLQKLQISNRKLFTICSQIIHRMFMISLLGYAILNA